MVGRWRRFAMLIASLCGCIVHMAQGLGSGAKIPAPTDVFKERGMNYFRSTWIRYSMTVSILSSRDKTFWGVRYNEDTEDYELHADFAERSEETLFELIDAGTEDNYPVNTKRRPPDYEDGSAQKFFVRFNETVALRSQSINKYVGTTGSAPHLPLPRTLTQCPPKV